MNKSKNNLSMNSSVDGIRAFCNDISACQSGDIERGGFNSGLTENVKERMAETDKN